MHLFVYIVKGVDKHEIQILDVFFNKPDAEKFIEEYDEGSFAYISIDRREVKGK